VPKEHPPDRSLFGLTQRVSDQKATSLVWSSTGKSVVRPQFFRDASHMPKVTQRINELIHRNGYLSMESTQIEQPFECYSQ
jgi:hypothetical protein